MRPLAFCIPWLVLTACSPEQTLSAGLSAEEAAKPKMAFFVTMMELCGKTVEGQIVSDQEVDADWRNEVLTVGPVTCGSDEIVMPLAVGRDRSRTWFLTRDNGELIFRHQHVEPDGSLSAVTNYGGPAREGGTATRQDFPADELTRETFISNGLYESIPNVWTLRMEGGRLLYQLARPATDMDPARDFRAEFDL